MFQRLDVGNQFAIVREERRTRLELAAYQRLADEHLARLGHIHRPVMHALFRIEDQSEQRAALPGRDLRRLLLPMWIVIMPLDQVRTGFFQPFRLDARDDARVQAVRLDQFARHHPLRAFFCQNRIRRYDELGTARTQIVVAIHTLHADVSEQPAQQCFVYLLVGGGMFVAAHARLGDLCMQLLVQLAPFAQTQRRQEIPAAFLCQQTVGLLVGQRLLEPCPYFQVCKKIGSIIGKSLVRGISSLLPVQRAFARILHR